MKKLSLLPALTFALLQAGGAGAVETPTGIYFDEISSFSITASAYAPTPGFTGLETGLSGVNVAKNGVYSAWRNGNVWTAKAAMPTARIHVPGSVIGGKVYVTGGQAADGSTTLAKNEEYDPVLNSWSVKANMSSARYAHAAGVVNNKIYVIGGLGAGMLASCEEYDPETNSWTTKASMSAARHGMAAGVIGGKIYVVGGWIGSPLNTNEEYDPSANIWSTKAGMPTSRAVAAAGVVRGKMYVFGGHGNGISDLPSNNEEYDPVTNTWSQRSALPTPRAYISAAVIGGKIFATGGWTTAPTNANEEYDPAANAWVARAPMITARSGTADGVVRGKLYAIGGGTNLTAYTTNEEYDPGVAFHFDALTPNTQYTFKAKARDSAGTETAESPVISTYTLAVQPVAGSPIFSAASANTLTFNWTVNGNPAGTMYRAQLSAYSSFSSVVTSDTLNTYAAFAGLSSGTTYYARVAALNGDGVPTAFLALGSTGTAGGSANVAPTLAWTGESEYISDGIDPQTGSSTNTYVYRVKYQDANGDAPGPRYPRVRVMKNGAEISGSPFTMRLVSGSYSGGAIYTYSEGLNLSGLDYAYYFEAQDSAGASATGAPCSSVDAPDVADVISGSQQGGYKTRLANNLFNPRSGVTAKIQYRLESSGRVSLKIYDVSGALMRVLFEGSETPGSWQREWDGKDDAGLYVIPGVYFLHYVYPGGNEVRKIGVK